MIRVTNNEQTVELQITSNSTPTVISALNNDSKYYAEKASSAVAETTQNASICEAMATIAKDSLNQIEACSSVAQSSSEIASNNATIAENAKENAVNASLSAQASAISAENSLDAAINAANEALASELRAKEYIEDIDKLEESVAEVESVAIELNNALEKLNIANSFSIGSIFQAIRTDVPANSLRADGTEYSFGFGNFVSNFLATGRVLCKSFDEWQTEYTMTGGNVGFFAYNAETGTFKVPCVQAGTFLAQAVASGEFGSFLNSSFQSHSHIQTAHNHDRGTMNITGSTYGARGEFGASGCFQTTSTTSAGISIPGQSTQNGLAFNAANSWTGVTSTAQPTILPTGGDDTYPKHIRYPFFVVVSNVEAESPSQVVWDNFIGNLAGKINTDLSNISASGKSLASKFGAPSSRYIDLELGASGAIYTAPANGWVCIRTITPDDKGFVSLALAEPYSMENLGRGKANECAATTLKVSAGAKFIVHYTIAELTYFRFHYAEGEVA